MHTREHIYNCDDVKWSKIITTVTTYFGVTWHPGSELPQRKQMSYAYVTFALKRLETHGTKRFHQKTITSCSTSLHQPMEQIESFKRLPLQFTTVPAHCTFGRGATKHGLTSENPAVFCLGKKTGVKKCAFDSSCETCEDLNVFSEPFGCMYVTIALQYLLLLWSTLSYLIKLYSDLLLQVYMFFCCTRFSCSRWRDKNAHHLWWVLNACFITSAFRLHGQMGWIKTGRVFPDTLWCILMVDPSNTWRGNVSPLTFTKIIGTYWN